MVVSDLPHRPGVGVQNRGDINVPLGQRGGGHERDESCDEDVEEVDEAVRKLHDECYYRSRGGCDSSGYDSVRASRDRKPGVSGAGQWLL